MVIASAVARECFEAFDDVDQVQLQPFVLLNDPGVPGRAGGVDQDDGAGELVAVGGRCSRVVSKSGQVRHAFGSDSGTEAAGRSTRSGASAAASEPLLRPRGVAERAGGVELDDLAADVDPFRVAVVVLSQGAVVQLGLDAVISGEL